jgi:hypothetical protein
MEVGGMEAKEVLSLGLGLSGSWKLAGQRLDMERRPHELHLEVVADRGAVFPFPDCQRACKAHDFASFTWQHLNFFQHHCLITARVPRVDCPDHGVKRVTVPWARAGSRFTLLFEQASLILAREMPVVAAARFVGITDKRLWRILQHYVARAVGELDLGSVRAVGLDETASKRGHNYVTVFIDMDRANTMRPSIFFRFFGRDLTDEDTGRFGGEAIFYRLACEQLRGAPGQGKLFLLADNEPGARMINRAVGRRAFVTPMPKGLSDARGDFAPQLNSTGHTIYVHLNNRSVAVYPLLEDVFDQVKTKYPSVRFIVKLPRRFAVGLSPSTVSPSPGHLSRRRQDRRCRDRPRQSSPPQLPWRLELHHHPNPRPVEWLFLNGR